MTWKEALKLRLNHLILSMGMRVSGGHCGRSRVSSEPRFGGCIMVDVSVLSLWGNLSSDTTPHIPAPFHVTRQRAQTHVELLPKPLAVVCRAGTDLVLQVCHGDGEVLLRPRRGPAEKHHPLLLCGVNRNTGPLSSAPRWAGDLLTRQTDNLLEE